MATWIWVLIAVVVVILVVLAAWMAARRRSTMLRQRFGPEYDRTVQAHEDRRSAEADLRSREKQRARIDIRPLAEDSRLQFADEWRQVQEQFVDQPSQAVAAADTLVGRVMEARGYPMRDFEAQADLVSVDHPAVVENYRFAHHIWQRSQAQQADTEDLREALLRYRSLFDELLQPDSEAAAAAPAGQAGAGQAPAEGAGYPPAAGYDSGADGEVADETMSAPPNGAEPEASGRPASDPAMREGGR